jgi:hypothetical protein
MDEQPLVVYEEHYPEPEPMDDVTKALDTIRERITKCSLKYEKEQQMVEAQLRKKHESSYQIYEKERLQLAEEYKHKEALLTTKYNATKTKLEKEWQEEQLKIQTAKQLEIRSYTTTILAIPVSINQEETTFWTWVWSFIK